MNRKEFLKIKEELQGKLGKWKLEIGDEIFADFEGSYSWYLIKL